MWPGEGPETLPEPVLGSLPGWAWWQNSGWPLGVLLRQQNTCHYLDRSRDWPLQHPFAVNLPQLFSHLILKFLKILCWFKQNLNSSSFLNLGPITKSGSSKLLTIHYPHDWSSAASLSSSSRLSSSQDTVMKHTLWVGVTDLHLLLLHSRSLFYRTYIRKNLSLMNQSRWTPPIHVLMGSTLWHLNLLNCNGPSSSKIGCATAEHWWTFGQFSLVITKISNFYFNSQLFE